MSIKLSTVCTGKQLRTSREHIKRVQVEKTDKRKQISIKKFFSKTDNFKIRLIDYFTKSNKKANIEKYQN